MKRPTYPLDFSQVALRDVARVGGKNASLGQLFNALKPQGGLPPERLMTERRAGYSAVPFPRMRQLIVDSGRFAQRKHNIRCLVEVDVTKARQLIREHRKKTGTAVSFTAFLIACVGRAVAADKAVHAYRDWRNRLIIFDDVDVLTYIEVEIEAGKFPLAHIVRAANRKTLPEIHAEIRAVQACPERSPSAKQWKYAKWFLVLPSFVRRICYWVFSRNPFAWKKYVGTVCLTAVGMFGAGGGWGIGFSPHTLGVIVGGIGEKPAVVDGKIEVRELLSLTLDFDHDIVDGAPAARFVRQFKELIEGGDVLA
jgi:pyruvate/2-oxoglutarate dehydrogenase complex dihydrolipoamide acyltransferase (E2) component